MLPMKILALETSTELASVALSHDGQVRSVVLPSPPAHSATLLPALKGLLDEQALRFGDLDAIACDVGPGAFTGVRLACSVAQGLALASGVSVVPVCSLLALAQASGADEVYCALDARMSEVYVGAYRRGIAGWQEVLAPCCVKPGELPAPGPGKWVCVGTAFAAYPDAMAAVAGWAAGAPIDAHPDARALLALAGSLPAQDPAELAPLYVRDRVALTIAERLASGGRA